MRKDKKVYWINVADIQEASEDYLNRKLTEDELKKVIGRFADYVNWYDALYLTFSELGLQEAEEDE